jgi:hypothetical protein
VSLAETKKSVGKQFQQPWKGAALPDVWIARARILPEKEEL